ncbi:MAG: glycoside hydrolase family 2 protein [Candidatus Marinimicrobia bacterium]|nr:glycoside hydrolase family 2 protein [Candidatus Neomarinimicrobiota bacterium]
MNGRLNVNFVGCSLIIFILIIYVNIFYECGKKVIYYNVRKRISINDDWRFFKYPSREKADSLVYDLFQFMYKSKKDEIDVAKLAGFKNFNSFQFILKPWVTPTGNEFIKDSSRHYKRPKDNPSSNFPFVLLDYDDSNWEIVDLPHDWAINGPFFTGPNPEVGGSMGRLPSPGVGWYRKKIFIPESDSGKCIFLEIDGAMSYTIVWVNGNVAGGWPYGYASWYLDITKYIKWGDENLIAIRLDNPPNSSRWYPGGGIYRNVWLTKTNPVHVSHWGTFVVTPEVSRDFANVRIEVCIQNDSNREADVYVKTDIHYFDPLRKIVREKVASFKPIEMKILPGSREKIESSTIVEKPKLWGPPPEQYPHQYIAVTTLWEGSKIIDKFETPFGIRHIRFDPDSGIFVNGELVKIKGVNLHHDLGPLGTAFNLRAAERQLEILREMGCNAIRTAHNPPAPELLELTDRLGFLVIDEIFDCWEIGKTTYDFHLIFPEWYEQDLRAFIRRDRNHPSVIIWSIGNEVGEQYTGESGVEIAKRLYRIVKEEDPSRPVTCAMNWAKPYVPLPAVMDVIGLNYQGEGIRQDPEFEGTDKIRTPPQYEPFHKQFPEKVILSTETAASLSSRSVYLFPVTNKVSDFVRDGRGGDSKIRHVNAYELYAADFGASPDKVFASIDRHPFVAGQFVWSGWDYLGEPTPYYESRSSYFGIIDLAGFKKDRFYLYQSKWRPDYPMAHILPHWNWPDRIGKITPVHVFTSGDEAELFLNGKSLGRKKKGRFEYRLRWDSVRYEPGELKVVTYKDGRKWAEDIVRTTGEPYRLIAKADRNKIKADGKDLAFITVRIADEEGYTVPDANNKVNFHIEGPGEIVATANGDPTDFTPFPSKSRKAFNGLVLCIVKSKKGIPGRIKVVAESEGLKKAKVIIEIKN